MDFNNYLDKFEQEVICCGIEQGVFTTQTDFWILPGTMANRLTERLKGDFLHNKAIVISYYGAVRRSSGFHKAAAKAPKQLKKIKCYLIHFNQVHFEHILKLAPHLISDFLPFKQEIVKLRWSEDE